MSDLTEETINSETVFEGAIITLRRETVRLPNGNLSQREIVGHPGAAAIVARTAAGEYLLVRQYRKAVEKELWELPAGKLDDQEDPLTCAQRELAEETGYQAKVWRKLTAIYTTPGFSNEVIHIYQADQLFPDPRGIHGDVDEFVEVGLFNEAQVKRMIGQGELCDAKSLAGLVTYWAGRGE